MYADWLEERGDPRGELIRIQCELSRMPTGGGVRAELEAREQVLLAEHEADWLGPLASPMLHWRFRRGFLTSFDHAGIFQSTDTVTDDEGYRLWTYLRFYADGTVLHIASDGTPPRVLQWFHPGVPTGGRREPPKGQYRLMPSVAELKVSFAVHSSYGTGIGRLEHEGVFRLDNGIRLLLDVYNLVEQLTTSCVYRLVLVELPTAPR